MGKNSKSKNQKKKKKKSGPELFDEYYADIYGERWPSLKKALLAEKEHTILVNPYGDFNPNGLESFYQYPNLYVSPHKVTIEEKENEKLPLYFLDGASALAPLSLNILPGDDVLDLTAAPGGKSLIMAYALKGKGTLTANDKSENRRFRLHSVLKKSLPKEFFLHHVRVTGFDASGWCLHEKEAYNKILLDAPCSSERHVLESPEHLKEWRLGRTKRLAALQWSMLASAWLVLKPGGSLVYSTCSLSPLENDRVVEKLVKKFKEEIIVESPTLPLGEKTQYGTLVLPDRAGMGPFYLSLLNKKPKAKGAKGA